MTAFRLFMNPGSDRRAEYGAAQREVLSLARHREVCREVRGWPGYQPTPLRSLSGLASHCTVEAVWLKDEGTRFGLGSFKALGGAYGVLRVLLREIKRQTGERVGSADLVAGRYRELRSGVTVTCATDGNHGRSVAWGAWLFGCRAVIYLPVAASRYREEAIAAYGAKTIRVRGHYDAAVRQAQQDADRFGRIVVSDTAYPGYEDLPRDVMQGYTVMVAEVLEQLPRGCRPTHAFVQAGVGGLAAAVCAHLWESWGPAGRPQLVVVEPESAAPLFVSAQAGEPRTFEGPLETVMACLSAGEVSLVAWRILARGADAFMTIPDRAAKGALKLLAKGVRGDEAVVAGESGVAGVAGLLAVSRDPDARTVLGLDASSTVLLFGTEGATDPEIYARLVGRGAGDVAAR